MGAELNSLFEFINLAELALFILTASSAWRDRASKNLLVVWNLNFGAPQGGGVLDASVGDYFSYFSLNLLIVQQLLLCSFWQIPLHMLSYT